MGNSLHILFFFITAIATPIGVASQLDYNTILDTLTGDELVLERTQTITFKENVETNQNYCVVTTKVKKLFKENDAGVFEMTVPFNAFEEATIKKARIYKIDTLGKAVLIENCKVKYADVKDYFVNGVFYQDLKTVRLQPSIDLPKNYIIDYTYQKQINDLKFVTSFYLYQNYEQVEKSKIIINKSDLVNFEIYPFNLATNAIVESDSKYTITSPKAKGFLHLNGAGQSYYLPHIILTVKSYNNQKVISSTEDLYAWYATLINQLSDQPKDFQQKAQNILSNNSVNDSIQEIFSWVQNNIQYVAFENGLAGFKPAEASHVLKNKYGDCKGMANLLVALLRSMGYDAYHCWIGTNSKCYTYATPSLAVDNHMICALKQNGQWYFLDPTSTITSWKKNPYYLEGKEALIGLQKDKFELQTVPLSPRINNSLEINVTPSKTKQATPKSQIKVVAKGQFMELLTSILSSVSYDSRKDAVQYFMEKYVNINNGKVLDFSISKESAIINIELMDNYLISAFNKSTYLLPAVLDFNKIFPFLTDTDSPVNVPFDNTILLNINTEYTILDELGESKIDGEKIRATKTIANHMVTYIIERDKAIITNDTEDKLTRGNLKQMLEAPIKVQTK